LLTSKSPKHYYKYAYKYDKRNGKYFIMLMQTTPKFNLDFRVRIESVGTEIVSTEAASSIKEVKSANEKVRHDQVCKIRPLEGKTFCAYYLVSKRLKKINFKLLSWSKPKEENLPRF
jgi:hypothetical protein